MINTTYEPSEIVGILRPRYRVEGDGWLRSYTQLADAEAREVELATPACPECGSTDLTEYSYDGGRTVTGYECQDCEYNWRA